MTNGPVCELCREHSGLIEQCRHLSARCLYLETTLQPDGIVFKEIYKVRKWMLWFMAGLVTLWLANTGLTYKAANNTQEIAYDAALKALKTFKASQP